VPTEGVRVGSTSGDASADSPDSTTEPNPDSSPEPDAELSAEPDAEPSSAVTAETPELGTELATEPAAVAAKKKKSKQKAKEVAAEALRRNKRLRIVLVAVAALAAVFLAGCIVFGTQVIHDRHINSARTSAVRAAQQAATDFSTYDYRTLDQNFARTAADLTGSFKTSYTQTAAALKATIVQYHETSTVKILATAAQSVTPHHAVVVVIFDQTVNGSNLKAPTVNRNRAMFTLVRSGSGRWLTQTLDLP
jgi:Mce-associated membrane protein